MTSLRGLSRPELAVAAPSPLDQAREIGEEATPVTAIMGASSVMGDLAAIATGRFGLAFLSFAAALMTTRMLGPVGYGTVAIVGIVWNLVFTASTSWTSVSVRRYGREELESSGKMTKTTWNRVLIGAPLVSLSILLVLLLKALHTLPGVLSWQLVALALAIALATIVIDHWSCLLETSGKMKVSASAQLLTQGTYVAVLAILLLDRRHVSPALVLTLTLVTSILLILGVAPVIWRTGIVPIEFDRVLLRRMLWLSTPLIGLVLSQYVLGSVDIVVLRLFRGQSAVGIYAVAYQSFGMLTVPATSATAVFLPLFVSLQIARRPELIVGYLERAVPQFMFAAAVVCGFGAPLLSTVMPLVFGQRFAGSAQPLAILLIGVVGLSASYVVAPILTLHEQTRSTAKINAVAAAINVAGDLLMVGAFGMGVIAPAIATAVALVCMFAAFYVRACMTLGTTVRPNISVTLPLLAGLVPAFALDGDSAAIVGLPAVAITSMMVLIWRSPFHYEDRELVAKLQMPPAAKRAAFWVISLSHATPS